MEQKIAENSTIDFYISRITKLISLIGLLGLLAFSAITVGEVLLRWLFNYPILGISDVSSLVIAVVIASCFPLVISTDGNITVKVVGRLLGRRVNAILEVFGNLVTLGMFGLFTWQLWVYATELAENSQTTWVVLWPMSPWYKIAAIILAFCIPILARSLYLRVKSVVSELAGSPAKMNNKIH